MLHSPDRLSLWRGKKGRGASSLESKSYFLPPFLAAGFSAVLLEELDAFGLVSAFFFISIYLWQSGIELRRFAI
jgi:hypothetical protein